MMSEPTHRSWQSAGLTLHYVAWGDPAAPLVVIHHGWLDQSRSWDPIAARLSERYRVVVVDARGHGDSEWVGLGASYYFPDYLLDLHHLLDTLGATGPVRLVGHSMGGSVMAYFAGAFPERVSHLVLCEGFGPPAEGTDVAIARLQGFVSTTSAAYSSRAPEVMDSLEQAVRRLRRADSLLPEETARRVAPHATRPVPGGLAWKYDPLHRARIGTAFHVETAIALWQRITAPVLALDGAKSAFQWPDLPARRAAIPTLERRVLPNSGHNLHVHEPDAVADAILAHLDKT